MNIDRMAHGIGRWIAGTVLVALTAISAPAWATHTGTRTSSFAYDSTSGLLTQEIIEPSGGINVYLETDYAYDAFGNKTTVTISGTHSDIATRATVTTYDSLGQFVISISNALSQTENWQHDSRFGLATLHAGPNEILNGLKTQWTYDTFGRKTQETRPDGTITNWTYLYCSGVAGGTASCPTNGAYLVTATPYATDGVTQNGPQAVTYYDNLGRVIRATVESFDGGGTAGIIAVDTQYDSLGRVSQTSRPYCLSVCSPTTAQWTVNTYDVLGRVVTSTAPNGGVTTTGYHGLTISVSNPLSQTNSTTKNDQGLVATVTDALSHSTTFVYDAFGDVLTTTDPSGNVIANTYDTRGRKTAMSDPDMGSWSYGYDSLSELVSQTDANGNISSLTYDLLGRMTQRVEADLTSNWSYDTVANGIGMLASSSTLSGYQRIPAYDIYSRPTSVTITPGAGLAASTISATYDANGRVGTVTYPSGFAVTYTYTTRGYQYQLTNGATAYWTANTRDAELHLVSQTAGNGVSTTQTFDPETGYLTAASAGTSGAVQNMSFTFDQIGDLTARSDANESLTEAFLYDSLDRLTSYQVNTNTPKTVTYDALGDITDKSDTGTYTYPASGSGSVHPHAVSSIAGTVNTTFAYDSNGNMTSGNGRTATWTSFNMVATIAGSASFAYVYDSEHRRVQQAEAGVQTTTYLNGLGVMTEQITNTSGVPTQWNDYLFAGGQMIGVHFEFPSGGALCGGGTSCDRYYNKDHLGSVAVLTDDSGTVQQRLSYDAWGKRRNADGSDAPGGISPPAETTRGFTGHEEIDDVALINMNGRVYDPTIGRFMSADPTLQLPYDGQDYNRYSYVGNNPLSLTDPTGYASWLENFLGGVARFLGGGLLELILPKQLLPIYNAFLIIESGPWAPVEAALLTWGNGGSTGDVFEAAIFAAASQGINAGIGNATNGDFWPGPTGGLVNAAGQTPDDYFGTPQYFENVGLHAAASCGLGAAQGQGCGAQALAAGFTAAAGPVLVDLPMQEGTAASAIVGGTGSVIGGGKFANGAVTGAFVYLFNQEEGGGDDDENNRGGIFDRPSDDLLDARYEYAIAQIRAIDPDDPSLETIGAPGGTPDPLVVNMLEQRVAYLNSFEGQLTLAIQSSQLTGGRVVGFTGPVTLANSDPTLSDSYQVRYQVNFADEFGKITNYSVNYAPLSGQFGIIKPSSGR